MAANSKQNGLSSKLGAHILNCEHKAERGNQKTAPVFKLLAILPPARPHLLSLPKQRHQLGTTCSNAETVNISLKLAQELGYRAVTVYTTLGSHCFSKLTTF